MAQLPAFLPGIIDDIFRVDAASLCLDPEPIIDAFELRLQRTRAKYALCRETGGLVHTVDVFSPAATRIQDSKMKNRRVPAACWTDRAVHDARGSARGYARGSQPRTEHHPQEAPPAVLLAPTRVFRVSPACVSWHQDIEAVGIITGRENDSPSLVPSSFSRFDGMASAAAAASAAGAKLAKTPSRAWPSAGNLPTMALPPCVDLPCVINKRRLKVGSSLGARSLRI